MPLKTNHKTHRQTGLYYYGARYYNPRTSIFISVDPLTEQTMTPYQYTYQNPINLTDPSGMAPEWIPNGDGTWTAEKGDSAWSLHKDAGISFEEAKQLLSGQINGTLQPGDNVRVDDQRIIFINGKLGMGSPNGGQAYWDAGFVQDGASYTGSNITDFENVDFNYTSTAHDRYLSGYNNTIKYGGSPSVKGRDNNVVLVTHSMGGAYGEGVADAMTKQGWNVSSIYHFNAFQAADMNASGNRLTVDFQSVNDPVINNPIRSSPGSINNATPVRQISNSGYQFIHRSPIDNRKTWNIINKQVVR